MLTTPLVALSLAASAVAGPLFRRQQADLALQVIGNLTLLPGEITTLNTTLNTVDPNASGIDFFTLIAIQSQSQDISNTISAATSASNNSAPFTADESAQINSTIAATEPLIQSLLNNFVAHKPAFENQGVTFLVTDGLTTQRELTREEGGSLQLKLTEPFASEAPVVTARLLSYFDAALAALAD